MDGKGDRIEALLGEVNIITKLRGDVQYLAV